MKGSEKQIEWAEKIKLAGLNSLDNDIKKWQEKVLKQQKKVADNPCKESSKEILENYQNLLNEVNFYGELIKSTLSNVNDAQKLIDLRAMIEKLDGGVTSKRAWDILHYIGGIKQADLPEYVK